MQYRYNRMSTQGSTLEKMPANSSLALQEPHRNLSLVPNQMPERSNYPMSTKDAAMGTGSLLKNLNNIANGSNVRHTADSVPTQGNKMTTRSTKLSG